MSWFDDHALPAQGASVAAANLPGLTQYDPGVFTLGGQYFIPDTNTPGNYIYAADNPGAFGIGGKTPTAAFGTSSTPPPVAPPAPPTTTAPPAGNPSSDTLASYLTNAPLLQPWTVGFDYPGWTPPPAFQAPTAVTEQNDPGYQFRQQQQQQAIERAASAKGTLLTGGTAKDLADYSGQLASQEYGNVYNRALTDYQTLYNSSQNDWTTNYNKAQQQYAQAYNIFSNNQANQFNRLASLAGFGQTSAGQLGSQGLGTTNTVAGINSNTANGLANLYTGAGNAAAAGTVGAANAWNAGIGNFANNASTLAGLYGSSYAPTTTTGNNYSANGWNVG